MGSVPNIHKIIADAPHFDESALAAGDNVIHLGSKTMSHSFGNDLRSHVDVLSAQLQTPIWDVHW
jgi:hypothetical protein